MDFVQGLNVTIYGLGIVFLALLVLMFSIMVLGKVFSVATGKEVFQASGLGQAPVPTVAQPVPPAQQPVAAPASLFLKMGFAGKKYNAELTDLSDSSVRVVLDGASYQVSRDTLDGKTVMVDGKAHTIEVQEVTDTTASVVIDGLARKIDLERVTPRPVAAAVAPAAAPALAVAPALAPAAAAAVPAAAVPSGGEPVSAPLPGKILSVAVKVGDSVRAGDELCVIEAMKMGNSIKAQRAGTVTGVEVSAGDAVAFGATLVFLG